jgi:hypothetical protein
MQLIVFVGTEVYVALAKGGLVEDHCLIVSIAHKSNLFELAPSTLAEQVLLKERLRDHFLQSSGGARDVIFMEMKLPTKGTYHTHLQCVPIPSDKVAAALSLFESASTRYGFRFERLGARESLNTLRQRHGSGSSELFYIFVDTGETTLFAQIEPTQRVPIQLGR